MICDFVIPSPRGRQPSFRWLNLQKTSQSNAFRFLSGTPLCYTGGMEVRYPRLAKRGSTYYCRVKVPGSLRRIIGKRELVRSLDTKDYAEAIRKLPEASAEANRRLDQARAQLEGVLPAKTALTPRQIADLLKLDRRQVLQADDRLKDIGIGFDVRQEQIDEFTIQSRRMYASGLAPLHEEPDDGTVERRPAPQELMPEMLAIDEINEQLARNRPPEDPLKELFERDKEWDEWGNYEQKAIDLLEDFGLGGMEIDEKSYLTFLREFVKARVETAALLQMRQRGEIVNTPPDPRDPGRSLPEKEGGDHLTSVYAGYAKEKHLPPTSTAEYDRAVRRFTQIYGDVSVKEISRPMIRVFKECLSEIPSSLPELLRKLPVPALLKELKEKPLEVPKLAADSINKQLGVISAILTWAWRNGYFDHNPNWQNPAFGIRIETGSQGSLVRLPLDQADLKKLFNSAIFTGYRPKGGGGEAAYWLPVLGLFTGARLEELGQLQTDDIKEHEGIPYMSINTLDQRRKKEKKNPVIIDLDKRKKTEGSKRPVPIHSELIRLGFLQYVDAMRARKSVWLFPDLKLDIKKQKRTSSWSKWWGRWTAALDLDHRDLKVFHSFRHTVKDALRDVTEDEELRDDILGQNGRGGVGRNYGLGHALSKRNPAIQRLKYAGVTIPVWLGVKGCPEN